ncbi:hypothetical protein ABT304_21990 [Nocardioides sp. NPDC000445]|uniref:hypothetical protein n=1 Tax=Nocardioides sp. NPDC000445 TaxID=3154257 RepID=UPI00331D42D9
MTLIPDPDWPQLLLAGLLALDVALSLRPVGFIRTCLNGVAFPENYWWTLIAIKSLAVTGLLAGIWHEGIGLAANVGVVAYFLAAVVAHLRARFIGFELWINCLGFLGIAAGALILSYTTVA